MLKKYGPENLAVHYAEFDTICDATQVSILIYNYLQYIYSFYYFSYSSCFYFFLFFYKKNSFFIFSAFCFSAFFASF